MRRPAAVARRSQWYLCSHRCCKGEDSVTSTATSALQLKIHPGSSGQLRQQVQNAIWLCHSANIQWQVLLGVMAHPATNV